MSFLILKSPAPAKGGSINYVTLWCPEDILLNTIIIPTQTIDFSFF